MAGGGLRAVRTAGRPRSLVATPELPADARPTVGAVFLRLLSDPCGLLVRRWNWKSAVLSSLVRAAIFFLVNLSAGLPAAVAAMHTELLFRAVSAGFYGALTEAFREAEPPWGAALAVALLLPLANHSVEFLVHWLRGTRKLVPSIIASIVFTALSSLFNHYAMRRGTLVVGPGRRSLAEDLGRMPGLLLDFLLFLPRQLRRALRSRSARVRMSPLCSKD